MPGHSIEAYALPGWPGRIVVSGRLLDVLDDRGRAALLAHERAHLAGRHHLFTTVAHLAAAANPLLLPVARAVDFTVERWADERAAAITGDRRLVASTIGQVALLSAPRPARPRATLAIGPVPVGASRLAGLGRPGAQAGRRPARPAPRRRLTLLAIVAILILTAGASAAEAARDLHALLEFARPLASQPTSRRTEEARCPPNRRRHPNRIAEDPIGVRYPNTARIWNYQLGGKDNFAVDREASDAANAMVSGLGVPAGADTAVESRHLLQRMVDYMLGQGVRQFLDLGSGLPNMANTHQIAHRAAPGARIVYVDIDPMVSTHAAALMAGARRRHARAPTCANRSRCSATHGSATCSTSGSRSGSCSCASCTACGTRKTRGRSSGSSGTRWRRAATWP